MELLTLLDIDRQVERLRAELGIVQMLAKHLAATVDSCAGPRPSAVVPAEVVASVSGKLQAWAGVLQGQLEELLSIHLVPTPDGSGRGGRSHRGLRGLPSGPAAPETGGRERRC